MTYRITFILRYGLITKTQVVAIRSVCEEYLGKYILLFLKCDLSRTTVLETNILDIWLWR